MTKKLGNVQSAPVASGMVVGRKAPSMRGVPGGLAISHSEYLCDIATTAGGNQVTYFALSAGSPLTFPWLSKIACNFSRAKFRNVRLHYRANTATTTTGAVVLAYESDSSQTVYPIKSRLLEIQDSASAAMWQSFSVGIKVDQRTLFVTSGVNPPAGTDIAKYSAGNVLLGIFNSSVTAQVGELWIDYTVELINPTYEIIPYIDQKYTFKAYSNAAFWPGLDKVTSVGNLGPPASGTTNNTLQVALPPGACMLLIYIPSTVALNAVSISSSTATVLSQMYVQSTTNTMIYANVYYNYVGSSRTVDLTVNVAASAFDPNQTATVYLLAHDALAYN